MIYRYLITVLIVLVVSQHLDRDSLYKTWKILAIVVSIAVIIQSFQIHVLHQNVDTIFLIPGQNHNQLFDIIEFQRNRPVAFFSEPSMVVAFLLPVVFFSLTKKEFFFALFLTISILLTASTSGIILSFILWMYFFLKSNQYKRYRSRLFIIGAIILFLLFSLPMFQMTITKLGFELSGNSDNTFGRVFSGWLLYGHLDIISQIFGIPDYDYDSYIRAHAGIFADYVSQMRMDHDELAFFFNTAQHVFLRTGIIGALLYSYFLVMIFKRVNNVIFPYLLCVIAMMFFEFNFFYHNCFVLQYILILSYLKK